MNLKRAVVMLSIMLCTAGVALAQTEWVQHPDNPVLGPGEPGAWDAGSRITSTVLIVDDTYHMWFSGYSGEGNTWEIGHATSPDGLDWTMDPANPVLTRGDAGGWDSVWLIGSAVLYDGAQFHMWYGAWDGAHERIGYATSPDGSVWTKYGGNPVVDVGPAGSWYDLQIRPSQVIADGQRFQMWLMGLRGSDGSVRIGYAESSDGIAWDMLPDPVLELGDYPGAWDTYRIIHPSVVSDGSTYHMWYAGAGTNNDFGIGYAFSSDGVRWTKHRDNPVILESGRSAIMSAVLRTGSSFHMWYAVGNDPAYSISYATSDRGPGVAGLNYSQYIPAAAVASGAEGAFYQTDLDLNNAGSQPVQYQLMWLPRGEDNSQPMTSEIFSLGAGMSVRYANVLAEVFDLQPNSLGALALLSTSADLLSMSRIYNTPSGEPSGTYGQAMPSIVPGDFIQYGERKRILFGTENADMRTNVGCQNGGSGNVAVRLELFDSEGTSLETTTILLDEWGNDQLNRIFEDYRPVNGYVEVWTPIQNGSFYCYGSVLDNTTSDPTTIPPQ